MLLGVMAVIQHFSIPRMRIAEASHVNPGIPADCHSLTMRMKAMAMARFMRWQSSHFKSIFCYASEMTIVRLNDPVPSLPCNPLRDIPNLLPDI